MKAIGPKGTQINLDVRQSQYPMRSQAACKSKIQFECGQLIKSRFPHDPILEEFRIPGFNFIIDFFLPVQRIAFEINGRQHDEYVPFFHKSKDGFREATKRDKDKKEFCIRNDFQYYKVDSVQEMKELLSID